ncbi:hypothetical protein Barb6_00894 [Bacteroidales bacterium Barb6]|nr:hypothetical protein Barb6_00894 [Bacteroidales bacterium Barb6]
MSVFRGDFPFLKLLVIAYAGIVETLQLVGFSAVINLYAVAAGFKGEGKLVFAVDNCPCLSGRHCFYGRGRGYSQALALKGVTQNINKVFAV